jgi:hypothetical protein
MLALGFSLWQLEKSFNVSEFRGYPLNFRALWIPGLLAFAVMLIHNAFPDVSILTLISSLSLFLTFAVMLVRHGRRAMPGLASFVTAGLPRMSGELVLFLSAGVLAAGISTAVTVSGIDLVPEAFGPSEASLNGAAESFRHPPCDQCYDSERPDPARLAGSRPARDDLPHDLGDGRLHLSIQRPEPCNPGTLRYQRIQLSAMERALRRAFAGTGYPGAASDVGILPGLHAVRILPGFSFISD